VVDDHHPPPGQPAGEGDPAGQRGQDRLADRAEQVDAAVARAVGGGGRVEPADDRGLGLQRPDAHRIGRGAREDERGHEQGSGQGSHVSHPDDSHGPRRPATASMWTNHASGRAVHDSRTATSVDYS
jgi:hypothetical protein